MLVKLSHRIFFSDSEVYFLACEKMKLATIIHVHVNTEYQIKLKFLGVGWEGGTAITLPPGHFRT